MPLDLDQIAWRNCAHVCVDMQRMFAEPTDWHAPWANAVLPAIEAITAVAPQRTLFTRFLPPQNPDQAGGAWRRYFEQWRTMTRDTMPTELLDLCPPLARFVPPGQVIDKTVYSPWFATDINARLRAGNIETLIVTGGETEICVLATILGAIDFGYQVVLPTDALCSSADETHDAMISIYRSRFGAQLVTCSTEEVLEAWA